VGDREKVCKVLKILGRVSADSTEFANNGDKGFERSKTQDHSAANLSKAFRMFHIARGPRDAHFILTVGEIRFSHTMTLQPHSAP
jgi:hypothetical protein